MKLIKENICVFIGDKLQLKEAKEMLLKYKEVIDEKSFYLSKESSLNYLYYGIYTRDWNLGTKTLETQITMEQLEEILKENK